MDTFFKEQLERLKTDYFDFYLLHGLNGEMWDRMRDLGVREFLNKKESRRNNQSILHFHFMEKLKISSGFATEYDWTFAQSQYKLHGYSFSSRI